MVLLLLNCSFYRVEGAIGWISKQPPVTLETVKTVTRIEWSASTPNQIIGQVRLYTCCLVRTLSGLTSRDVHDDIYVLQHIQYNFQ